MHFKNLFYNFSLLDAKGIKFIAKNVWIFLYRRKFQITEKSESYKTVLTLRVKHFTDEDDGTYRCSSTNSLGKSETTIRLYAMLPASPK